jgi:YHS domain-containing protein
MSTMKKISWVAGITMALTIAALADSTNSPSATTPVPDLMTTCPVSGDKLGEMAPPVVFVYQGQEVKLCCKMCKPDFDKDPDKYLKKIRAADAPPKSAQ